MKNSIVAVFAIVLLGLVGFAVVYSQKPDMFSAKEEKKPAEPKETQFKVRTSQQHKINDNDLERFKRAMDLLTKTYEKMGVTDIELEDPHYTNQCNDPEDPEQPHLIITKGFGMKGETKKRLDGTVGYDPTVDDDALKIVKSGVSDIVNRPTTDRGTDKIMSTPDLEALAKEKEAKKDE